MTVNGWVQVAVQLPDCDEILLYQGGEFVRVTSRRRMVNCLTRRLRWTGIAADRDHLEFAEIGTHDTEELG